MAFAALAASCVYPIDIESSQVEPSIVVDGDIVVGGQSSFEISKVFPLDANQIQMSYEKNYPVGQAWIEDGGGKKVSDVQSGHRFLFDTSELLESGRYSFHFKDKESGREYASDLMPVSKAPEIENLRYSVEENVISIVADMDTDKDTPYFTYRLAETWEYIADFPKQYRFDTARGEVVAMPFPDLTYYYCWNSARPADILLGTVTGTSSDILMGARIADISRSSKKMSSMYRAEVSARGTTMDGYKYIENMKKISTMGSSLFSPNPSEMYGNVVCLDNPDEKVMGYVSVCTETSTTMYIPGNRYYIAPSYLDKLIEPIFDDHYPNLMAYYKDGFLPVAPALSGEIWWGTEDCMDCRSYGGTKTKPEGWPTNNK